MHVYRYFVLRSVLEVSVNCPFSLINEIIEYYNIKMAATIGNNNANINTNIWSEITHVFKVGDTGPCFLRHVPFLDKDRVSNNIINVISAISKRPPELLWQYRNVYFHMQNKLLIK